MRSHGVTRARVLAPGGAVEKGALEPAAGLA
jgi:hypothetical protein